MVRIIIMYAPSTWLLVNHLREQSDQMVTCLSYSLCSVCHVRTWHTLGLCHTNFHSLSQLLPLTWNIQSKSPYAKSYFKSVSVTQPLKSDFNQIRKWLYVNIRSVLNYLQWTQLLEDVLIFMDMKYSISFIIIFFVRM